MPVTPSVQKLHKKSNESTLNVLLCIVNCMQGLTPLFLAAQSGHTDVLKLLLASGANAVGKSVGVSRICGCVFIVCQARVKQCHTLTYIATCPDLPAQF